MENLKLIAQKLVANGKGILAADESTPTCTNRFKLLGVNSTEEARNEYRSMLFSTPSLENYISGVILFDETFYQNIKNTNTPIPQYLTKKNIIPGIKVDAGAKILAQHSPEKITEGLDGLRDRLQKYHQGGARFAKWRAVITINNDIPSEACLHANAHALARYASLCQESGLVPIVEPEVLMDGSHNIEKCYKVSNQTLKQVFQELHILNVDLEAIILKPNMILPGSKANKKIENTQIAQMTFEVLKRNVSEKVPGIAFLSGGQSCDLAAERLNELNKQYPDKPWKLTFSYGRALQKDSLATWAKGDFTSAQAALIHRAKMNYLAAKGEIN
tara:strand:+ start:89 stop:1081 length:993 start_codon:yes stop_codon:yes gene_type:complete